VRNTGGALGEKWDYSMNLQQLPLISIVTFLPLVGRGNSVLREERERRADQALHAGVEPSSPLWCPLGFLNRLFAAAIPGFQFHENQPWIRRSAVGYQVGLDGISLLLILLTTGLMPLAILSSFNAITDRVKEYYIFLLFAGSGHAGRVRQPRSLPVLCVLGK